MISMRKLAVLLLASSLFLTTACREVLHSNLSEGEANQMLQTLLVRGIDATKVDGGKKGYSIEVQKEDLLRALEILKEQSLPRTKYESLGSVFTGQGMISSQTEEQSRLAYALAQELSDTFSKIDGVLDAKVHVVLVHHEQASGITTPPSAAIFIRHTKDSPVVNMVSGMKDTVARSVPGLGVDRVSVLLEQYDENIVAPKLKVTPWYETVYGILGITFGVLALLGGIAFGVLKFLKIKISIFKENKE